jgi:hypothetical protein
MNQGARPRDQCASHNLCEWEMTMRGAVPAWMIVVGILAAAPAAHSGRALACMGANHPGTKIAAIDNALPASKIAAGELAEAKELRQKAYDLTKAGKLSEAHAAANLALTILGGEWSPPPPTGLPTRC